MREQFLSLATSSVHEIELLLWASACALSPPRFALLPPSVALPRSKEGERGVVWAPPGASVVLVALGELQGLRPLQPSAPGAQPPDSAATRPAAASRVSIQMSVSVSLPSRSAVFTVYSTA